MQESAKWDMAQLIQDIREGDRRDKAFYEALIEVRGCAYLAHDPKYAPEPEWVPVYLEIFTLSYVKVIPAPNTPYAEYRRITGEGQEPIIVTDYRRLLILPAPQPSSPLE